MQNTHAMQFVICIVFISYLGTCLGCGPLAYIPPPAELESVKQSEETQCTDCTRSQARFFFGLPCCTEPPRADLKRMQNATDCGRKGGTAPYLHKDDENLKIIGGVPALENEFPWQVGVMTENETWRGCGAILISCDPLIVVSAAHCFKPFLSPPGGIKLSFGAQNMGTTGTPVLDTNEVRLDVEEVIIHPSFSPITIHAGISGRNNLYVNVWENDIAVIKIKNGTNLNCEKMTIWPVCLPNKDFEYGGWNRTVVTGWGRTEAGGNASTVLMKARIPIVTDEQCLKNFLQDVPDVPEEAEDLFNPADILRLAETKMCAGDIESGLGICQGDSGGPLVAQDEESTGWSAVGIVSYLPVSQDEEENPACGGNRYGVFTEVGKYLDWIGEQFDLLPPEKFNG